MRRKLAESTWESYERNIRVHVAPSVGHMKLQELDGIFYSMPFSLKVAPAPIVMKPLEGMAFPPGEKKEIG